MKSKERTVASSFEVLLFEYSIDTWNIGCFGYIDLITKVHSAGVSLLKSARKR